MNYPLSTFHCPLFLLTPNEIYWITTALIILASLVMGCVFGKHYGYLLGYRDGIESGGDIWREALGMDNDDDEDDSILNEQEVA